MSAYIKIYSVRVQESRQFLWRLTKKVRCYRTYNDYGIASLEAKMWYGHGRTGRIGSYATVNRRILVAQKQMRETVHKREYERGH